MKIDTYYRRKLIGTHALAAAGILTFILILGVAGWIEGQEARDRYEHCVFMNIDSVYTDTQAADLKARCAIVSNYTPPEED